MESAAFSVTKAESPRVLSKRVVRTLREQGFSLSGCQLVQADFEILSSVLEEEDNHDRVAFYLNLCRTFKITNGYNLGEFAYRYAFVQDNGDGIVEILASSLELSKMQRIRFQRRLNRTCGGGCRCAM